jgi:hypothetical protein
MNGSVGHSTGRVGRSLHLALPPCADAYNPEFGTMLDQSSTARFDLDQ